ncbi:hypothetical protein BB561_004988 [Smittium simulii]|uniref:Uncharacterized protein n=1 Tax=Smittium simulii TaxID=133385 RepID=A0A2T9YCY7_9FUNG|nr:hypothetical protein BB561_004988 [Smittium simulii]
MEHHSITASSSVKGAVYTNIMFNPAPISFSNKAHTLKAQKTLSINNSPNKLKNMASSYSWTNDMDLSQIKDPFKKIDKIPQISPRKLKQSNKLENVSSSPHTQSPLTAQHTVCDSEVPKKLFAAEKSPIASDIFKLDNTPSNASTNVSGTHTFKSSQKRSIYKNPDNNHIKFIITKVSKPEIIEPDTNINTNTLISDLHSFDYKLDTIEQNLFKKDFESIPSSENISIILEKSGSQNLDLNSISIEHELSKKDIYTNRLSYTSRHSNNYFTMVAYENDLSESQNFNSSFIPINRNRDLTSHTNSNKDSTFLEKKSLDSLVIISKADLNSISSNAPNSNSRSIAIVNKNKDTGCHCIIM